MLGRNVFPQSSVFPTRVSADGNPMYKAGGITIDWTVATTASGDVTLADGSIIKDTLKYLRYGQILTRITSTGKFGPYKTTVTDGRELLVPGRCFILDQTVLQYSTGSAGTSAANDIIGEAIEGGAVWFARILQSGVAVHSETLGPTKAEVLAAFPNCQFVMDE